MVDGLFVPSLSNVLEKCSTGLFLGEASFEKAVKTHLSRLMVQLLLCQMWNSVGIAESHLEWALDDSI